MTKTIGVTEASTAGFFPGKWPPQFYYKNEMYIFDGFQYEQWKFIGANYITMERKKLLVLND